MSTHEIVLLAVIGLWLSPFILIALTMLVLLRNDRRRDRETVGWLDGAPMDPLAVTEHPWGAPATHADHLHLVERRATVIDLDSRRQARRPENAA